jgi:hypothetical protein
MLASYSHHAYNFRSCASIRLPVTPWGGGLHLSPAYVSEWFKPSNTLSSHSVSFAASSSASLPLSSLKSTTGSNRTNLSRFDPSSSMAGLRKMPFGAGLPRQRVGPLVAFCSGDRERDHDRKGIGILDAGGGCGIGWTARRH